MSENSGGRQSGLIDLVRERPGIDIRTPDDLGWESCVHPWPLDVVCWRDLAACDRCGLNMLKLFINSSAWVIRRVEHVSFLDECTVRRRVGIDYVAPQGAMTLCRPNGEQVQILPLAIMRRKSLVKFDFRNQDGRALPLLGLRQNQALTMGCIRAWAAATMYAQPDPEPLSAEAHDFLDDVVAGDQIELWRAFDRMWNAGEKSQLRCLGTDDYFRVVLNRLADSFVLFGEHDGPPGERRLTKFSYDEPLTLRYSKSSYQEHTADGEEGRDKYENTAVGRLSWTAISPAMGFTPTRIKFPVPAAELASSFHFEVSAPPEVSIINAKLLAGRPKPEPKPVPKPVTNGQDGQHGQDTNPLAMKSRERRRPSFDRISGGYPTVDLHVADVPYGSRSRAQVEVEARVDGWFATAVFSAWLSSGILLFAYLAKLPVGVGSTLLMSFVAGLAVLLVHQDAHRLVTRLLSKVRLLANFSAVLALAAAVVMATNHPQSAHGVVFALFLASLVPTSLISASWLLALRRSLLSKAKESPWEHHRPRISKSAEDHPDEGTRRNDESRHEALARMMEEADYPYDWAYYKLGFSRPAIRVASSEGGRQRYFWDKAFARAFHDRLDAYLQVVMARAAVPPDSSNSDREPVS